MIKEEFCWNCFSCPYIIALVQCMYACRTNSIERFGESKREKTFVYEKKNYIYDFFQKLLSHPLSGVLNILWCKFSTESPIHTLYYIYINVYVSMCTRVGMYVCMYVHVCIRVTYIYIRQSAGFFYPFFFLSLYKRNRSEWERGWK